MPGLEEHESRSSRHLVFMAIFGVLGWAVLGVATQRAGLGFGARGTPPLAFSLFLLVIFGARSMAFRMLPETLVSLDSAFYIAAVACLGSISAGWLVAVALTLDAILRLVSGDARRKQLRRADRVESLVFVAYFGGMTGGLLCVVGWLFAADTHPLVGRSDEELQVLLRVFALGLTLLFLHYLIQGARLILRGHDLRAYVRRMALPGIVAETSLLPLAVVVVVIYDPDRPLGFVLLGITYLLINYVFNRLSHASESLRQRVGELETLNRTAQTMASTLQQAELVESIGKETLAAVPEAELFALSRVDPQTKEFVVDWLERDAGKFERLLTRADDGISAWVVAHKRPLCLADLTRPDPALGLVVPSNVGVRSWLGVPLVIYDEVVGVLSVQSRERGAFGPDRQRLLEAIGGQAAVAIQNARLYELATVDGLTGLYVRRYFDSRLREELERSRRFGAPFSVELLDIDDFKRLNDTYGHALGDRVLREVAASMRRNMRNVDLAARYGGEEFAFILPRTSMIDAHAVAERIRHDISELRIAHEGQVLRVTASVGVACYPESGPGDTDAILERADIALYRAKATGKNRVELFWAAEPDPAKDSSPAPAPARKRVPAP